MKVFSTQQRMAIGIQWILFIGDVFHTLNLILEFAHAFVLTFVP